MPVTDYRKIDNTTLLGIWKITENLDELLASLGLSSEDEMTVSEFATDQRKKQWLAYRLLIKNMLHGAGFTIIYDQYGKPHLKGGQHHLSVTHTGDYAAVIMSSGKKVGIDIEMVRPRIDRVSDRFLSPEELAGIGDAEKLGKLTVYWCVKEALYKLFGRRRLDFIKNIRVPGFVMDIQGSFEAMITTGNFSRSYSIHYEFLPEMVMVYVLDDNVLP